MTQQQQRQSYLSNLSTSADNLSPNEQKGDSATFVKPQYEGSSQLFTPYTFSQETAIPPPPPYLYPQLPQQPKRNKGYVITLVLLMLLVVGLGSLEVFQVVGGRMLAQDQNQSLSSNQSSMTSAQHASASYKATPLRTLTSGTTKENILLTCGVCDNPILITINTITIDTTNKRMIWVVKLNNVTGSEQVDNFSDFSLQDPSGNIYVGTGNLNKVFILSAGQIILESVIFSFLPRPGAGIAPNGGG
jgi:hypothetical protein